MKNHNAKRLFSLFSLAFAVLFSFFLTACGEEKANAGLSAMQLRELALSEEAKQVRELVDTHSSSQIFEYRMDENMKELHFFIEELKDGKMTCLAQAGGPAPESGTFAILFDPDEITLSWDGAKYSALIDTTPGYTSSVSSHLTELSSVAYNEKTAAAAIACTQSNSIESFNVTDYENLVDLVGKYDRALFVTIAFTDASASGELVSYGRSVRSKSALSEETIQWLERYNQLDIMDQLAFDMVPSEFIATSGSMTVETAPQPLKDEPVAPVVYAPAPEDRLLIVDGRLYRGTRETGPMGDSGCVDGTIQSVVNPEENPVLEGQANFGKVGNPYTWDGGDGAIMVFDNEEYYIFRREGTEPPLTGTYCAFIKRIDGQELIIDPAEWITADDTDRMEELGLTEADMPDGYYIHNPSRSRVKLSLTKETSYHFIDWGRDFVRPDSLDERKIETSDPEQFQKYLASYADSEPGMPFFIE